ncbi:response regulator/GGDEF domain protein [Labilithrix luteola]|uniref:diguanylate cyclase n=1 Tax=Labilithrix luteola TaxID=1391654 RepID=A0A0K1PNY1_9BACT|nr:GGDEF domain-containing protein [Labilithrix luteola]AKU95223.1 response regulator/GGDEF domain protein [Labilithrix luteola]
MKAKLGTLLIMASDRPYRAKPSLRAPADDEPEATRITSLSSLESELRARRQQHAYVVVLQGSNVGEMFKIEGPETVIGRAMTVQVRLNDDGISRRHCRVLQIGGQVIIEDLGSANGTLVNGEMVQHQALNDGDKIRLGATTMLKFTYQDKLDETFQQQMYDAALRDGLTRTYNKKFFLDRLETEFSYSKRHRTMLSLVMFDVDHFKRINDTYGHLAGDAVLVLLARTAQATVRQEDVLARYGGEEFAIICRGTPLLNAGVFAERLRMAVEQTSFEYGGVRLPVNISVGVTALPEVNVNSPVELIAHCDEALYEAKRSGRNRVCMRGI